MVQIATTNDDDDEKWQCSALVFGIQAVSMLEFIILVERFFDSSMPIVQRLPIWSTYLPMAFVEYDNFPDTYFFRCIYPHCTHRNIWKLVRPFSSLLQPDLPLSTSLSLSLPLSTLFSTILEFHSLWTKECVSPTRLHHFWVWNNFDKTLIWFVHQSVHSSIISPFFVFTRSLCISL